MFDFRNLPIKKNEGNTKFPSNKLSYKLLTESAGETELFEINTAPTW